MQIITKKTLQSIRFGLLYRKLALNNNIINDLNEIEKEIYLSKNKIKFNDVDNNLIVQEMKDVFSSDISSQLLWLYRCIFDDNGCYLYHLSPYMKEISTITRGGLNVYKRLGWDIHVLYAYQLICENFKMNKQTAVIGAPSDFSMYQKIYNGLSPESEFILKISTFLHDIGVVDGVKDHDKNGVKWVEQRFNEIGFNAEKLSDLGISLPINDIYSILRFVVGNHQIINQIGSELGDCYVSNKIREGQDSLNGYGLQFFNSNIANIMYLLSAADIMAVDDILLTSEKIKETKESLEYFHAILSNKFYERNSMKYGIQRFKSLLNDSIKIAFSEETFKHIIAQLGYNPKTIANFIYYIPKMSYAMTFVKPQKDYMTGLKMFCAIFEKFTRENIDIKNIHIKFNPDIDYKNLGIYINKTNINSILEEDKLIFTYNEKDKSMSIT